MIYEYLSYDEYPYIHVNICVYFIMKKYSVLLNKINILTYSIRLSERAKRVRLAIYPDGDCVVIAPKRIPLSFIERFINQKSQWIIEKINYFKSLRSIQPIIPRLISPSHPRNISKKIAREHYLEHRNKAQLLVEQKVAQFNAHPNYRFTVSRLTVRNQKTRWGSCSHRGNLNFNYRIALLPERLADYVIVHEICHLGQFNHSKDFWDLVAEIIPDHRERRRELKKISHNSLL